MPSLEVWGGATLNDGLDKDIGDGAGDPSSHDVVHADPIRGVRGRHVREEMAL